MTDNPIDTDYLVVGAGASAMAFVDTLLTENPQARVLMVDRRAHVGGHWNDAYSFVQLHQPAAWYGVPSRLLAAGTTEARGPNTGMQSNLHCQKPNVPRCRNDLKQAPSN